MIEKAMTFMDLWLAGWIVFGLPMIVLLIIVMCFERQIKAFIRRMRGGE